MHYVLLRSQNYGGGVMKPNANMCLALVASIGIVFFATGLYAQDYVGSSKCQTCHSTIYDNVFKTGHPHKLKKVEGGPPTYPENTSPGVPNPPPDKTWDDISYVIGGYGWKARFMDKEGYILTGENNRQYNLANSNLGLDAGWSGYDAAKAPRKPYTCGACHTTGWVATGETGPHQDDLPGIYGTWSEPGVTCEACHGPGSEHVADPSGVKPSKEERCADCHSRGDVNAIDAKGGLIRHHEQYEDLLASPHKQFACATCHDPHLSTKYDMGGFKGDENTCKVCHANIEIKITQKANFECETCHMPYAVKSAVAITVEYDGGSVPVGDIRSHIFRIQKDPNWQMFTDDGKFVRLDDNGKAWLNLAYTCMRCHTTKTLQWAAENAEAIHKRATTVSWEPDAGEIPTAFALYQNYPNPFNPSTTIAFDLKVSTVVELKIYNMLGQELATILNERLPAGRHKVSIRMEELPSGFYIYQLRAGDFVASKKMLLMK